MDELQPGQSKVVDVAGKSVGVFHEGGTYHAVLNFCPHAGAPICLGRVRGAVVVDDEGRTGYDHERRVLRCPWHHWEFDLATGKPLTAIREKLKTYPVRVEGDEIQVDI
ncbi:Rieske (2Fe-2S) protein [Phycisphaerales bacterium AB-hyl4]|uniref:Rieske (2Fe-2S) protein n=1 Tax=Natronomicrosphaera hydrolytica TaxID=3242702 RepID=A0ABV4U7B0_9BACT